MFYGTDNIPQNILHSQIECWEYFVEYCQSHIKIAMDMNDVMQIQHIHHE